MTANFHHLAAVDFTGAAWALPAGFALGLMHFATLRQNASWFADGRPFAAAGLQLLRMVVLVGVFATIARFGALPLLSAALGLLIARRIVVARARRLS